MAAMSVRISCEDSVAAPRTWGETTLIRSANPVRRILKKFLAVFGTPTVCPGGLNLPGLGPRSMKPLPPARPHGQHRPLPARIRLSLGAAVGIGLLVPSTFSAAGALGRMFDIPAGDATTTLKHFAAQASEQLLYSPDDVSGIKTQAVQGELLPLAALNRMLERTPLKARQDESTKAISITVTPSPRAPLPSEAPPPVTSTAQTSSLSSVPLPRATDSASMKKRRVLSFLASFLTLGLSGTAQTIDSGPGSSASASAAPSTAEITGRVQN